MSKQEYEIKSKNITKDSEETSTISLISYEIENANNNKLTKNKIDFQIKELQRKKKFPSNLEYIDSHTDKKHGVTASAFLNKDTGKVIIGMTGTNFKKEALAKQLLLPGFATTKQDKIDSAETKKDLFSDVQIGTSPPSDSSKHYEETQEFIKKIKNKYDIDFITGHSLGGREAVILGMSNGIPNIVVYNPAPIAARYLNHNSRLFKLYKGYKGNITRIVSDKDWLTNIIKGYTKYTYFGNEIVVHNGKSHDMAGFLTEQEQKAIKKELKKVQGYVEENNKSFVKNSNNAMSKLASIELLRANMMTANGGWLSSSQQKVLESLTALTIAQSFSQLIDDEINQIKKMYNEKEKKFEKNWEDAQKAGNAVGKDLSVNEVLEALDEGQVNESSMVGDPEQMISAKERQLSTIGSSISYYILRVRTSINEIVDKDQVLASQIGGLL
ncbi:lipase family protein [Staphylococcus argenteus]